MPRDITVTFEDGSTHVYRGAPDDVTPDSVTQRASQEFGKSVKSLDGGRSAAPGVSRTERIAMGMADPIHGGAQLLTKALPEGVVNAGNRFNNWLADKTGLVAKIPEGGVDQMVREREAAYQAKRGEDGFDGYRLTGNVASPVNLALGYTGSLAGKGLTSLMAGGAATGAASGALTPATSQDQDFADEKQNQLAIGALGGAIAPALVAGVSRVISPLASKNPLLQKLRQEGVGPTIGQALGGSFNRAEEKLTSVPIVGDMISRARRGAMEDFNRAAINRATSKVGAQVDDVGFEAVAKAGDQIGKAYDDALSSVSHVKFDGQFADDLGQLRSMSRALVPEMRKKFDQQLRDIVGGRTSQANAMLPETFKKVDSELGKNAARYGKSTSASEQELGDALKQLQSLLRQQAARNSPEFAEKLSAADEAWANLVRIEGAAKAAKNAEGVFSPAQLNQAIQAADSSVRKRAVSRGNALMQDLGNAGQTVLGNKVPDSGTAGRLMNIGALSTGFFDLTIPLALAAGGGLYTRPTQRLLVNALASRPEAAQPIANALRNRAFAVSPAAGVGLVQLNK